MDLTTVPRGPVPGTLRDFIRSVSKGVILLSLGLV